MLAPAVVVVENPVRGSFQIVELTVGDRPPEREPDEERKHDGQRDEQVENFHRYSRQPAALAGLAHGVALRRPVAPIRARREALATTRIEDADMPRAATNGVKCPVAASGIAIAL
jgi:hypothetical protein